jgi:hypothetical protein
MIDATQPLRCGRHDVIIIRLNAIAELPIGRGLRCGDNTGSADLHIVLGARRDSRDGMDL